MVPSKRGAAGTLLLGRRDMGPPAVAAQQQHRTVHVSRKPRSRVVYSCARLPGLGPFVPYVLGKLHGSAVPRCCALRHVFQLQLVRALSYGAPQLRSAAHDSPQAGAHSSPLLAALQPTDAAPSGPLTLVPMPVPGVGPEMLQDPATDMAGVPSMLGRGACRAMVGVLLGSAGQSGRAHSNKLTVR